MNRSTASHRIRVFEGLAEILIFGAFVVLASASYGAAVLNLGETKNTVSFLAVGKPSALKIRGKAEKQDSLSGTFEVKDGKFLGTAVLKLNALETGISLRDEHMKDRYLETTSYPTAQLTVDPVAVVSGQDGNTYEGPFSGKLKLHGIEKPIQGTLALTANPARASGAFNFSVELEDFGIETPSYLGITVSKTVHVEASFKK